MAREIGGLGDAARADLARRLAAGPAQPVNDGGKVEGQLCSCGCGKPLQRLPDGRLGVVTFSMGAGGQRFNLPLR